MEGASERRERAANRSAEAVVRIGEIERRLTELRDMRARLAGSPDHGTAGTDACRADGLAQRSADALRYARVLEARARSEAAEAHERLADLCIRRATEAEHGAPAGGVPAGLGPPAAPLRPGASETELRRQAREEYAAAADHQERADLDVRRATRPLFSAPDADADADADAEPPDRPEG